MRCREAGWTAYAELVASLGLVSSALLAGIKEPGNSIRIAH